MSEITNAFVLQEIENCRERVISFVNNYMDALIARLCQNG